MSDGFGVSDAGAFLLPDLDDETSTAFWAGTARGELLVQACGACGVWRMPPRPMCPACQSVSVRWEPTNGNASIWSFIVPHPPLLAAYAELAPYNAIVVALDQDPTIRFVGNLLAAPNGAINEIDPATIEIGEPVRVVFQTVEDVALPRWVRR
ncbi:MAG: zinc ribbon domain-containing protein [Acidimicrobiia bacterium]